jgi:glycosyltransferase involved in cell wall biosynthesis
VKKEKPDILISFMAEPNYRAVLATRGLGTKTLISVRNDPNKEYSGKMARMLAKHLLPKADGCVFQTQDARDWFPKSLQKKSCVIANAVNPAFFDVERAPERGSVVTCGRLNAQKNHDLLIKAFAEVASKHPHAKLDIYGDGALKAHLQEVIDACGMGERITLCGATNHVAQVLSKADMFVMSSDYEGMPNALMEAMAAGVPCVSTDCPCGGPRMLIDDKTNGLLVPVGDEAALANAMDTLLGDAAYASEMGIGAKNKAFEFSPDIIFEAWRKYVYSVISNGEEASL